MSTRATSVFEITLWEESVYDEPADGPTLSRAIAAKTFTGNIEGTSTAELSLCKAADDVGGGYVAQERIEGRVGERSGSFVIQHGGIRGCSGQRSFGSVVPGSGTGELRGMIGDVEFAHDETGARLILDYDFEPPPAEQ